MDAFGAGTWYFANRQTGAYFNGCFWQFFELGGINGHVRDSRLEQGPPPCWEYAKGSSGFG